MFGREKTEKRFKIKEEQSLSLGAISILLDTHTGVNYIMTSGVGQSGLTPLLDSDGHVVVDGDNTI